MTFDDKFQEWSALIEGSYAEAIENNVRHQLDRYALEDIAIIACEPDDQHWKARIEVEVDAKAYAALRSAAIAYASSRNIRALLIVSMGRESAARVMKSLGGSQAKQLATRAVAGHFWLVFDADGIALAVQKERVRLSPGGDA